MFLKKISPILKISTLLITIVIVSVLHFIFSKNFEKKHQLINNSIKILERNEIVLNEIKFYTEKISFSDEIENIETLTNSINIYTYSISILINGGISSSLETNINIPKPKPKKLQDLIELERLWNEFNNLVNKFVNSDGGNSKIKQTNIQNAYLLLLNKQEQIINSYSIDQRSIRQTISTIHIAAIIIYLIIAISVFLFIKNNLFKSIDNFGSAIDELTLGSTEIKFNLNSENDFSNVYSKLNKLNYKINDISDFVNQLVKDNYDVRLENYNQKDVLALSLIKLRNKLKENIELNKKRQDEEHLRQWFAEGQAKFNDILRESSTGIKSLAEASLKNLVKFFGAAQGGFFILNDNNNPPILELASSFAYDRIKALTKSIQLGDGLVGMCALEKNTIWLNNVPDGYMEIESGLGEASPTNILIIPVKTDENLLGVIEIASLKKFNKNEVQFIENIADDIASTLQTTKISDRTSVLLEESHKKSNELAMRDSEMSEKIVELRDAQKETKRSETEMTGLINAVDKVLFKIEVSTAGRIITANNLFLNISDYRIDELRNKNFFDMVDDSEKVSTDVFEKLKKDKSVQTVITLTSKQNKKIKILSIFSAIKNEADQIVRILFLGDNISYREELEKRNETLSEEIKYKTKLADQKEKEFEKYSGNKLQDIKGLIERERTIKQSFETKTDKKYAEWLNDIKK